MMRPQEFAKAVLTMLDPGIDEAVALEILRTLRLQEARTPSWRPTAGAPAPYLPPEPVEEDRECELGDFPGGAVPVGIRCNRCGKDGFHWVENGTKPDGSVKYRLADEDGHIHFCKPK